MSPKSCFTRVIHFLLLQPGQKMTTTQLHVWAILIGMVLGVLVTGYSYAIEGMLILLWRIIPNALIRAGLFNDKFGPWNMNWITPLVWGGAGAGLMLWLLARYKLQTGTIVTAMRGIHTRGLIPFRQFFPMLFVSLVTITAGGSAGPEASVIIMGGGLVELLNRLLLGQQLRERRILTLAAMSAALSAFFQVPLSGAIFVLEIPHHNGLEYYEAISVIIHLVVFV